MDKKLIDKLIVAESELDDVIVAIFNTDRPLAKELDVALTLLSNLITRLQREGVDKK
jgi:hypothetical protein